jgi:tryptophan synthase alpha chain
MFQNKLQNNKALIPFVVAGDPSIEITERLVYAMVEAGADSIEIGIPFSDPFADGPVIQAANRRALTNGTTVDQVFEMLVRIRRKVKVQLILMIYLDTINAYGKERFLSACRDSGVDGIIVAGVPFEEQGKFSEDCTKFGIDFISKVAPFSNEQIAAIAKEARGFLYCVSSFGVTGTKSENNADIERVVAQAKKSTDIPCLIGFGISNPCQARDMAKIADGVMVGSAIVKIIEEYGDDCVEPVKEFVKSMKDAIESV